MAKTDWGKVFFAFGAMALLAKVLEEAKKNNNQIYRCWRCNYVISKNEHNCPNCGAPQNWKGLR